MEMSADFHWLKHNNGDIIPDTERFSVAVL